MFIEDRIGVKSMKAVLKNMRKSSCFKHRLIQNALNFIKKYYFMKFDKGLDSSKLFESLAMRVFSEKSLNLPV